MDVLHRRLGAQDLPLLERMLEIEQKVVAVDPADANKIIRQNINEIEQSLLGYGHKTYIGHFDNAGQLVGFCAIAKIMPENSVRMHDLFDQELRSIGVHNATKPLPVPTPLFAPVCVLSGARVDPNFGGGGIGSAGVRLRLDYALESGAALAVTDFKAENTSIQRIHERAWNGHPDSASAAMTIAWAGYDRGDTSSPKVLGAVHILPQSGGAVSQVLGERLASIPMTEAINERFDWFGQLLDKGFIALPDRPNGLYHIHHRPEIMDIEWRVKPAALLKESSMA